ncbi:chemotaxis protein CheW [Clostridium oryzae]|uniref:Chemotaxis protein CheW n=1 Tax=Clostridium oryzae TaxID=1450648 RepID=A0A1V4IPG5_9CLOT|nr:chemotaxis protein CheW [Clostridium oryzae]OPJ61902.1 chemotaxis protein CheW [Clostridium oryzae]
MIDDTEEVEINEEDTQKDKYLIFEIEKEFYGVEIRYVTEIIGIHPITEVPEVPDYIMGIINLRGKIIPVMDVRIRFKKEFKNYTDRTCIIIVDMNDVSVGLIVDGVAEVISISEENVVQPPEFNGTYNKYIKGIGKAGDSVKLILDCDKLLSDKDNEIINGI